MLCSLSQGQRSPPQTASGHLLGLDSAGSLFLPLVPTCQPPAAFSDTRVSRLATERAPQLASSSPPPCAHPHHSSPSFATRVPVSPLSCVVGFYTSSETSVSHVRPQEETRAVPGPRSCRERYRECHHSPWLPTTHRHLRGADALG